MKDSAIVVTPHLEISACQFGDFHFRIYPAGNAAAMGIDYHHDILTVEEALGVVEFILTAVEQAN